VPCQDPSDRASQDGLSRACLMVMRAAIFHEPRSITVGHRPDPSMVEPTDAIVRRTQARTRSSLDGSLRRAPPG
jgi:hypothetical protein